MTRMPIFYFINRNDIYLMYFKIMQCVNIIIFNKI